MEESSQETPLNNSPQSSQELTTGPSRINPPKNPNHSFYFEMKPARLPKLALEALCDPEFNPSGKGRIDVNEIAFMITVLNPDNVFGCLALFSKDVENYHCNKIIFEKLIDLREISGKLVDCNDEDTMTILHENGSNEITFSFGEEPARGFVVEILENSVEMPLFPDPEIICHAIIDSISMSPLIDELVKNGNPQPVSVDLTKYTAAIVVGQKRLEHNYKAMGFGDALASELAEGGQRHHGWFYWPYPGVMRKALLFFHCFFVSFLRNPTNNIQLRFMLPKLGQLLFLKEVNEFTPGPDTSAVVPNLKEEQNTDAFAVVPN